jgi:predicted transcriptional regulator
MDIQAEKIQLIEWLAALNKPSIIKKIISLKEKETDWWDEISAEEKSEIEEGFAQADRGQLVPHQKVMNRYKKIT